MTTSKPQVRRPGHRQAPLGRCALPELQHPSASQRKRRGVNFSGPKRLSQEPLPLASHASSTPGVPGRCGAGSTGRSWEALRPGSRPRGVPAPAPAAGPVEAQAPPRPPTVSLEALGLQPPRSPPARRREAAGQRAPRRLQPLGAVRVRPGPRAPPRNPPGLTLRRAAAAPLPCGGVRSTASSSSSPSHAARRCRSAASSRSRSRPRPRPGSRIGAARTEGARDLRRAGGSGGVRGGARNKGGGYSRGHPAAAALEGSAGLQAQYPPPGRMEPTSPQP